MLSYYYFVRVLYCAYFGDQFEYCTRWCRYGIKLTVSPKYSYLGFVMGIFHTIKSATGLVAIRKVYVLLPEKMKQPLYTDRKNIC